ncbi:hypothetical protein FTX61_08650 [Nitriliruptoraceae bacterium ZYF776]|nr:hypothetical protein [Profundirhabdus halotolerans]
MPKVKLLVTGAAAAAGLAAWRRRRAAATPSAARVDAHEVAERVAAAEGRLRAELVATERRLTRARRAGGAFLLAAALLLLVPTALVVAVPQVPDGVLVAVLLVDLLVAAGAIALGARWLRAPRG